jgi:CRP-like cAMP-binding protein
MAGPHPIFSNLRVRFRERDLEAGQTLFRTGQRTIGAYQVLSGRVRLARVDRSGRETVLYTAGGGDMIAEASLFSSIYHCDAIASTAAKVRLYAKDGVLAEFKRNPEAAKSFMTRLARQVMDLRTRMELRNIHSARDRVRHYLALHAGTDGATVAVNGTLKELAAELALRTRRSTGRWRAWPPRGKSSGSTARSSVRARWRRARPIAREAPVQAARSITNI